MQHRHRRSTVGLILIAIVAGAGWLIASGAAGTESAAQASASSPEPAAILARVEATGASGGPGMWLARHEDPGVYELSFATPVDLAIRSWDVPAGVTVRPVTDRTWRITFIADAVPVDSGFDFRAAPIP